VLAEGLGDAELVIFENSSHMAFIEEREAYIRVAEAFLGRVEAGVADEA
jgi:pimeloyl-ACP methyl ester carboxylesterase